MEHSTNQPLNQVVQTNVRQLFPATPLIAWQPRASAAYKLSDKLAIHAGGGVFNDIIRRKFQIWVPQILRMPGFLSAASRTGGRHRHCTRSFKQRSRRNAQAKSILSGRIQCRRSTVYGPDIGAATCPLAVNLNTFPSGTLKTPYFLQWSLGVERELGTRGSLRVDYVGTRAVHEPYQVQLNGYQTVCQGCFAPFPYNQPADQRFGNVNEFRTDAAVTTPACKPAHRNSSASLLYMRTIPTATAWMWCRTVVCSHSPASASSRLCPAICVSSMEL